MPSFMIHCACANEYLRKHPKENKQDFVRGVLSVDLATDKAKSHYSKTNDTTDLKIFLAGKVSLEPFVINSRIDTSFERGRFFHLLTDYEFYNNFFRPEFLDGIDYARFKKILYHDYFSLNDYVKRKYHVVLPDFLSKYDKTNNEKPIELTPEHVDNIIEKMSNVNLEQEYYQQH